MLVWWVLASGEARAVSPFHVETAVVDADVVALGKVTAVESVAGDVPRTRLQLKITSVLGGRTAPDTVEVWFPDDGEDQGAMRGCAVDPTMFPKGTKVLVYGHDFGDGAVELLACRAGTGLYRRVSAGTGRQLAIDQHGHALYDRVGDDQLARREVFDVRSATLLAASNTLSQLLTWDDVVERVESFVPDAQRWMVRHGFPLLD